jgi:NADH-quinone oxidoreductase subunit H
VQANTDLLRDAIRLQIWQFDFGLIFYFAILTLANYGGTIAGWASYNKWALLGGLRSSSQMMSYEVAMGLSLMGTFLVVGSLEPGFIVAHGASASMSPADPLNWLWLWQPLGLILFFTAAIAETKRAPFDLPEGEPEIIGYFVEYSGLRFGMFFLGEFLEIVVSSAIMVTIFFGGWSLGGTIDGWLAETIPWSIAYTLITLVIWTVKVFLFCAFQLLIRWSLPRFRSDQLMRLGWQRLLPLSIANVVVTAIIMLFVGK